MKNLILFLIVTFLFGFSNAQSTSIIGQENQNEYAYGICSDQAGNTYLGATLNNQSLVIKRDSNNQIIWSNKLGIPQNFSSDISYIDIIGDTIFGCGWLKSGNTILGGTIFKLNAITGTPYWIKYEGTSKTYFSSIKYSNGKYFVTGSQVFSSSAYNGKVIAISSTNGTMIWETPSIGITFPGYNINYIDDFTSSTEMINGAMYITGRSYVDGSNNNMRTILIGINETGNVFLSKYLQFNTSDGSNNRFYGINIQYDGPDSLVILQYGDDNCTNCTNNLAGLIKTDLNGNVSWCKEYDLAGISLEAGRGLQVTPDNYYLYGFANLNQVNSKMFAIKTNKLGDFQNAKLISLDIGNIGHISGPINCGGSGDFINNKLYIPGGYFTTNTNSRDILQVVLDSDLNDPNTCFDITQNIVSTKTYTPFSGNINLFFLPNNLTFSDVSNVSPHEFVNPCNSQIVFTQNYNCENLEITASGVSLQNPIYSWSNGASFTNTTTLNSSDTLILTISSEVNCCSITDTIIIDYNLPTLNYSLINDTLLCSEIIDPLIIAVQINNSSGSVDYFFGGAGANQPIEVYYPGTYYLFLSDNCTSIVDSFVVNIQDPTESQNDSIILICDSDFPLTINTNLTNQFNYLWDSGETSDSLIVNSFGTYTLYLSHICSSDTVTFQVNEIQPIIYTPFIDIDTCLNQFETIHLVPTISSSAQSIIWNNNNISDSIEISTSGVYWVEIETQCETFFDTIQVLINNFVQLPNDSIIQKCSNQLPFVLAPSVLFATSVNWNNGTSSDTIVISNEGTYSITATNNCNSETAIFQIIEEPIPIVNLGSDYDTCVVENQLILLTATIANSNNIIWNTGENSNSISLQNSGLYFLTATNNCGSNSDSINITVNKIPNVNFSNSTLCLSTLSSFFDSSSVSNSSITQWNWNFGDGNFSNEQNPTHIYSTLNDFNITLNVTTNAGCSGTYSKILSVNENNYIPILFNNSPIECSNELINLQILNPESSMIYQWNGPNNFTSNSTVINLETNQNAIGTYSVYSIFEGCKSQIVETSVSIISLLNDALNIPNVITPNDDGINDELNFYLLFSNCYEIDVLILNRWGNVVFNQNNVNKPFKGIDNNGDKLSEGVYFYKLKVDENEFIGNISIHR